MQLKSICFRGTPSVLSVEFLETYLRNITVMKWSWWGRFCQISGNMCLSDTTCLLGRILNAFSIALFIVFGILLSLVLEYYIVLRMEYCTNKWGDCLHYEGEGMAESLHFVLSGFSLVLINGVFHKGKRMYEKGRLQVGCYQLRPYRWSVALGQKSVILTRKPWVSRQTRKVT